MLLLLKQVHRHVWRCLAMSVDLCPMYPHSNVLQVWPAAVLIAQALGEEAVQSTLRVMSSAAFPTGSPLHIFGLLAAADYAGAVETFQQAQSALGSLDTQHASPGAIHSQANSNGGVRHPDATQPQLAHAAAAGSQQPSVAARQRTAFVPQAQAAAVHPAWHATLIMLAAHRAAPDAIALGALGDCLWQASTHAPAAAAAASGLAGTTRDRAGAHVCYMLAGRAAESAFDPEACFVLPGADHKGSPSSLMDAESLQRADLHASCLQQSTGMPMYNMAPYYLVVRAVVECWPIHAIMLRWHHFATELHRSTELKANGNVFCEDPSIVSAACDDCRVVAGILISSCACSMPQDWQRMACLRKRCSTQLPLAHLQAKLAATSAPHFCSIPRMLRWHLLKRCMPGCKHTLQRWAQIQQLLEARAS